MAVRSLRVGARDPMMFALRAGLVGLLVLALAVAVFTSGLFGAPGLTFFTGLCYIDLLFLTLLGISSFSTVITEEREADTLGLLRLAGFRSISILLGKSLGHLVTTALLLIVQLPFAVLAVTLGGISAHQVYAAYVVLIGYAVFVYGVALLASVTCQRGLSAARLTALVLACVIGLPPLCEFAVGMLVANGTIATQGAVAGALNQVFTKLGALSPLTDLREILATGFGGTLLSRSALSGAMLGLILVLVAWQRFPLIEPAARAEQRAPRRRGRGRRSLIDARPRPRGRAFVWKDFRMMVGGERGLKIRFVLYGVLAVILLPLVREPGMSGGDFIEYWGIVTMGVMALAVAIEAGVQAGRVFREELQQNTLFGLALVPTRIGTWAFEKVRGSMLAVVPAGAGFVVALAVVLLFTPLDRGMLIVSFACVSALYVGSLILLAVHVTMLLSLYLRKGAFPATVGLFAVAYSLITLLSWVPSVAMCGLALMPGWVLFACLGLDAQIGQRLRQLASR